MSVHVENLVQLQETSCERFADRPCFGTKHADGWTWMTYRELGKTVDAFRAALASLGVQAGDRVAIIANNRVEWAIACYATHGLEAAFVPMYEAQRPEDWEFILRDCEASVVLAGTARVHEALLGMAPRLPRLRHIIGVEQPAIDPMSFTALVERGKKAPVAASRPSPETIAGFIYTSGTTGPPKGVLLSHRNLASNITATASVFPIEPSDRTLSFLPWAHVFGQTCELHYGVAHGVAIAINDDVARLIDNLADVKPTILVAVPRIFHRLHAIVVRQLEARPKPIRRLLQAGLRASIKRRQGVRLAIGERIELGLDERLLFAKVRKKLGGRLRMVISGSAALNPEVAEFIDALGIPVYEGYGLSEASPIVAANFPGQRKIGSVGKPIPGVTVDIDTSVRTEGDGEIIVHGPNVMRGYHNRPDENARAFTADGGLRTGDLGHFDDDGFLHITGRIKEQYKLENGKYVMPALLEEELKMSPFIAQALVYGANRPYNVALIVPNREAIDDWAHREQIEVRDLASDERVHHLMEAAVAKIASSWRSFDVPKRVLVVAEDFTLENGLLTPTLKVKRQRIEESYAARLAALYEAKAVA